MTESSHCVRTVMGATVVTPITVRAGARTTPSTFSPQKTFAKIFAIIKKILKARKAQ